MEDGTDPEDLTWDVFDFETWMFRALLNNRLPQQVQHDQAWQWLRNAKTECLVLHTRVLVDILLSRGRQPDDINVRELLPGFESDFIATLDAAYGRSNEPDTPCWTFNKRMAHATVTRTSGYDYTECIQMLMPTIEALLSDVESVRQELES